jgi:hypothetical protein
MTTSPVRECGDCASMELTLAEVANAARPARARVKKVARLMMFVKGTAGTRACRCRPPGPRGAMV